MKLSRRRQPLFAGLEGKPYSLHVLRSFAERTTVTVGVVGRLSVYLYNPPSLHGRVLDAYASRPFYDTHMPR